MRSTVILCLLLMPMIARAEDPFACVTEEVRSAFLSSYNGESIVYSTMAAQNFESLDLPRSFSLVGSSTRQNYTQTVYTSSSSPAGAVSRMTQQLRDAGWTSGYTQGMRMSGFQSTRMPVVEMLCSADRRRSLTVNSFSSRGDTFVSLSESDNAHRCAARNAGAVSGAGLTGGFSLPLMRVPEEAGAIVNSTGSSSGAGRQSTHAVITGFSNRQSLKDLIDAQISEQGWRLEGSWDGSASSGSSWVKSLDDGSVVAGTLSLVNAGDSGINGSFHAVRAGTAPGAQTLMSISGSQ